MPSSILARGDHDPTHVTRLASLVPGDPECAPWGIVHVGRGGVALEQLDVLRRGQCDSGRTPHGDGSARGVSIPRLVVGVACSGCGVPDFHAPGRLGASVIGVVPAGCLRWARRWAGRCAGGSVRMVVAVTLPVAWWGLAATGGLRLGESLGLAWGDVDLSARTLRVRRALQRFDGKLRFVEPKSESSNRRVALPESAVVVLRRHRVRQQTERLLAGERWQDTGLVFTTTIGTPLDDRNVRKAFGELLGAAELPPMRIHDLRHTCASLLLAQGGHPRVVMETLGHSQISLTLDTYSHVMPTLERDAADRMDAVLTGSG